LDPLGHQTAASGGQLVAGELAERRAKASDRMLSSTTSSMNNQHQQQQHQQHQQRRPQQQPHRQSSIPVPNALLSTVNANRQRLPMCSECEKSLPNQIVFDKVSEQVAICGGESN